MQRMHNAKSLFLVDGAWTMWSAWGSCSVTCGGGDQSRTRSCEGQTDGGAPCQGDSSENQSCNTTPCPSKYLLAEKPLQLQGLNDMHTFFKPMVPGQHGHHGRHAQ